MEKKASNQQQNNSKQEIVIFLRCIMIAMSSMIYERSVKTKPVASTSRITGRSNAFNIDIHLQKPKFLTSQTTYTRLNEHPSSSPNLLRRNNSYSQRHHAFPYNNIRSGLTALFLPLKEDRYTLFLHDSSPEIIHDIQADSFYTVNEFSKQAPVEETQSIFQPGVTASSPDNNSDSTSTSNDNEFHNKKSLSNRPKKKFTAKITVQRDTPYGLSAEQTDSNQSDQTTPKTSNLTPTNENSIDNHESSRINNNRRFFQKKENSASNNKWIHFDGWSDVAIGALTRAHYYDEDSKMKKKPTKKASTTWGSTTTEFDSWTSTSPTMSIPSEVISNGYNAFDVMSTLSDDDDNTLPNDLRYVLPPTTVDILESILNEQENNSNPKIIDCEIVVVNKKEAV